MQEITIKEIKSVKDEEGKYGPQKKIWFEDVEGRSISGWVAERLYNASEWHDGATIPMVITQNGQYTNFKIPSRAGGGGQSNQDVMEAMRKIYKRIEDLEKHIDSLFEHRPATNEPPVFSDSDDDIQF